MACLSFRMDWLKNEPNLICHIAEKKTKFQSAKGRRRFELGQSRPSTTIQGDQIGRIFAYWANVNFGQFLWKLCTEIAQYFWLLPISHGKKLSINFGKKCVGLHFGRILTSTSGHPAAIQQRIQMVSRPRHVTFLSNLFFFGGGIGMSKNITLTPVRDSDSERRRSLEHPGGRAGRVGQAVVGLHQVSISWSAF
jgi:hypothetical protein